MPATAAEIARVARDIADQRLAPDFLEDLEWADGTHLTEREAQDIFALAVYEVRLRVRRKPKAQRRALRLLRRHLTPEQQRQLRVSQCFVVQTASGRLYRLYPYTGGTHEVERHGKRLFAVRSFCLHDAENDLPSADLSLAHLLWLSCDEAWFLATANAREHRAQLWNGEYLRRMSRARREREAAGIEGAA